jgi:NNP family nitrate/nitrite transporter-like MFS transporter
MGIPRNSDTPWASQAQAFGAFRLRTLFARAWRRRWAATASSVSPAVPMCLVWVAFFPGQDAPRRVTKKWNDYAGILKEADSWWFCFICITFGGFVGLASYLSVFFRDQYHVSKVQAGDFTTVVVLFGSFLRPVGGMLADRVGGYRMLLVLLTGIAVCLAGVATLPPAMAALGLLAGGMAMMGMGNGSVFQLVPQRFAGRVGIITGIVGAAGGFGGFLLPSALGAIKGRTGTFGLGFALLSCVALAGAAALLALGRVWRSQWAPVGAPRRTRPGDQEFEGTPRRR